MKNLVWCNAQMASTQRIERIAAVGFAGVRVSVCWDKLQDEAWHCVPSELAELDRVIADCTRLGLGIYATVAYTPAWATDGAVRTGPPRQLYIPAWRGFLTFLADRYQGKIQFWSLWNEPDKEGCWTGTLEQYVNLILDPGYKALKAVDPSILVAAPDFTIGWDWVKWLKQFLQIGGPYLDVLSCHCYARTGRDVVEMVSAPKRAWYQFTPSLRQMLSTTKYRDIPVILSEYGWNTRDVSERDQASYYDQVLEALPTWPWDQPLIAFQHEDESGDEKPADDKWGLWRVEQDGIAPEKPVVDVFRRRIMSMRGIV